MSSRSASLVLRVGLLFGIAVAAGITISASSGGANQTSGSASAVAVSLVIPGGPPIEGGASGSATATQANGSFRYPDDGSLISVASYGSSASGGEGNGVAQAVVDVPEASLFGGEVAVTGIATRARARVEDGSVIADGTGSSIATVTLFGQPVAIADGQSTALGDWGSLVVGGTELVGTDGQRQIIVRSIRVTLIAEHGGLPAGTEITLGTAVAELQVETASSSSTSTATPAAPTPSPKPNEKPRKRTAPAAKDASPKGRSEELPVLSGPPDIDVSPQLTEKGYVFPIFGQAWFSSTLGAARANTGWHHGTDIFAVFGSPVLAITDGTLFSVGWNKVGGYRLWLRDRQGNQFYYAHLAGYTPLAKEGREVRAGQAVGFTGNTGDAQGTPFHVHFEVHPVGLLPFGYDGVVDPYPYLLAWRRLQDVALTVGTGWAPPVAPTATAPRPGAILLQSSDISTASGLEQGALERAVAGPASGSNTFLDPSTPCAECKGSAP